MTAAAKKDSFGSVDMLNGPIFRALIIFAIPIFISNVFQQMYNTVDTMIVGHVLGDSSLAAIGSCGAIFDFLVGFAMGLSNGLTIVTARSYGSGDENMVKKSVAGSLIIGLGTSFAMTVVGYFGLYPLLKLLKTPADIIDEAYSYAAVVTLFVMVTFAYNLCSGLMRAIGNSVMPLVFLIVSSVLNILLDLLFIARLDMGVFGAGVATVISQAVSVVLCMIYVFWKVPMLIPSREHFKMDADMYKDLLGQGYSMMVMNCIVSVGTVILQYGINGMGTLVIAGHTAGRKLYMFFNMPIMAMTVSCSTFVSQNKGANQGKRIIQCLKCSFLFDILCAVVITVFLAFAARPLVALVSGSSEAVVLDNGTLYLQVVGPFYAVLGVLLQSRSSLQGIGQKVLPLISSVIEFVGKIVFVIVFIPRFQYLAVAFCEPVIWCCMAAQLLFCLLRDPYLREARKMA
ncbi:MAG: MATE family efflux transporter [Lachnospiraceae bacterium]